MPNLPPNWSWVKLSDVIGKDGVFVDGDWVESKDQDPNGDVRLIQLADIGDIEFRNKSDRYLTYKKALELNCTFLDKGDLLIARMPDPLGRACIFPLNGKEKYVTVVDVAIVRVDRKKVDNDFLCYIINAPQSRNSISSLQSGSTRKRISRKNLGTVDFPLPPLPEQKKIVEKIEELFSGLDNGVASLKKAKEQIRLYRQSVLSAAFSGKLTQSAERQAHSELPEGWEWVKNSALLKYVTSGSRDWKKYYSSEGSFFIRTQDINTNRLKLNNCAYVNLPEKVEGKRSLVEEGDLLMTITGANVGKVALVDFPIKDAYVSQSVALLKYADKKNAKYLWYYFQAPEFGKTFIEKLVYGMGRPVLSLENMREVEVLICPLEDQVVIISEIEKRFSEADNLEKAIDESLAKSETLRQSILKQAFEGKLV